ncbi:hypothetical protein CL1_0662 [Thermococcus cleftensis]|uniref:Uncharacterized protein n=1 Tax=Thermococcus cleftensis (strain DSM 27260 / KACC 17922 / CL1) TaxID=163003 RepID=I3ZT33_THECF|nr:hypothetical protein [Thermococcus cleftensis]AFL94867.1 hypothetical protein CL1_0662 [Thermococcus cleftensis]
MDQVKVSSGRGRLTLAASSLLLSVAAYWWGFEFLGQFLLIFGFIILVLSFERTVIAGDYRVRVRKRGAAFEVEVFQGKKRVWRGNVSDYSEFGDFAFDVRGGKVAVTYRGEEVGLLP